MARSDKPTRRRFADWGSWLLACVESLADGVVVSDAGGLILFVNSRMEAISGYRREELLGRQVELLVPERFRHTHVQNRLDYGKRPRPRLMGSGLELTVRRADGSEVPVEVSLSRMETEEGPVVVSAVRDISERIEARRALKESEARAERLLENLPDGVVLVSGGRFVYVNRAFSRLVGWSREEVMRQPVLAFFSARDRARASACGLAILGGSHTGPNEYELRRKDGQIVSVEVFSHPLPHRGPPALLSLFRDITKRKKAEEEGRQLLSRLHQARNMSALGTLAAGVGHDFNNVLQTIIGYGGMALVDVEANPHLHRKIKRMLQAAERGADTVRRLLGFSRQLRADRRPTRIEDVVGEALDIVRPTLSANVTVRWGPSGGSSLVNADAFSLREAVVNLLVNARAAVEEAGGAIEVSARDVYVETPIDTSQTRLPAGVYVCLRIRDTGPGIDGRTRERIFEPFFTTREIGKGEGLGLAVVQGIVTQHGGCVVVASRRGRGASFDILLPLADGRESAS